MVFDPRTWNCELPMCFLTASRTEHTMKTLSKTARQVRSRLKMELISLDSRIGMAIELATKPRKPGKESEAII